MDDLYGLKLALCVLYLVKLRLYWLHGFVKHGTVIMELGHA